MEVSSVAENNVVVQKHGSVAVGGWIASSKNETYHQVSFVYFSASSTRFKGLVLFGERVLNVRES